MPIVGDIPLVGVLFRGVHSKGTEDKLCVFVKAEIIRPAEHVGRGTDAMTATCDGEQQAFEQHERESQNYEDGPGVKAKPAEPEEVLEAR